MESRIPPWWTIVDSLASQLVADTDVAATCGALARSALTLVSADRVVITDDDGQVVATASREAAGHPALPTAVHGIPLDDVGVLLLHTTRPHDWSDAELGAVRALSSIAAVQLRARLRAAERAAVVGQLQEALDSRVLIEQAKGVLAATDAISVHEAFEQMRRQARDRSVSLRSVAAAVLAERLRLPASGHRHDSTADEPPSDHE